MPVLSKQVLEEIRSRCDIVDVIGSYLQLKRAGNNHLALCPFHKEKSPSFNVSRQRQFFHCFGCGAGGDVFKFVMQYESLDFMGAVRLLAERAGIRLQFEEGAAGDEHAQLKLLLYKVHEQVAHAYHEFLLKGPEAAAAREYLAQRQLGADTVEAFQLGYAPARSNTLVRWGAKKGFKPEELEAAGLLARGEDEHGKPSRYDRFRGRLMFPLRDNQGRVIGFSGRILEKSDRAAKYVNSPETPLFRKGQMLFALDRAHRPMLEARTAVLCEGQIDVIRCHAAGVTNAVAALGTAVTDDHARLVKRYADEVVLVMDADTAGQNSAIRSSEIFMANGLSVRVATLPPGEDPDTLIVKEGPDRFREILAAGQSAVDFQIDVLSAREGKAGDAGRLRVARAVLETISKIPSAIQQDQMLQHATRRLNVGEAALREDLRHLARRQNAAAQTVRDASVPPVHVMEEVEVARLLVHHPECLDWFSRYLPPRVLRDKDCRLIVETLLKSPEPENMNLVAELTGEDEAQRLASDLLAEGTRVIGDEIPAQAHAQDLILKIRRRDLEDRRKELQQLRDKAEGADMERLDREIKELVVDINSLRQGWQKALSVLDMHA